MKKFKYFAFALAAALALGACSSSDDVATDGGTAGFSADGTGYVSVSLNLPTQTGNRASDNDQFEDGTPDEYKVKNAALILFSGNADPAQAKVATAWDLTLIEGNDQDNDNITTQYTAVKEITNAGTSDDVFALVVVNYKNIFSITADNKLSLVGGSDLTGKTLSEVMENTVKDMSKLKDSDGFFFMTNAPVVADAGDNSFVTTSEAMILVDVKDNIKPTKAEAQANPAADIYVERALAKVTLSNTGATVENKPLNADGTEVTLTYTITGWDLANTNTESYFMRNWNTIEPTGATTFGDGWFALKSGKTPADNNLYRFAGLKEIKEPSSNIEGMPVKGYYRTYFGADVNYNTDANFTHITSAANALGTPLYCMENTFDVERQKVKNTTCAIIRAQLSSTNWSEQNFYVADGNTSVIYTEEQAKKVHANKVDLAKIIAANSDFTGATDIKVSSLTWKSDMLEGNKMQVESFVISYKDNVGNDQAYNSSTADVADVNNANRGYITKYVNNEAYYVVLIKHFGDELTPWNKGESTPAPTAELIYPAKNNDKGENNYLGRYGVLRNNWYEIAVSGIRQIGSPVIPNVEKGDDNEPGSKWDDELESYIACQINILSWAKRTQTEILK